MKRVGITFVILLFSIVGVNANASRWGFSRDRFLVGFDAEYFKTTENFNEAGNRKDLANGNSYLEVPTRINARYDMDDSFSFFSNLAINSAKSATPLFTRSSTAVSDFTLGADVEMFSGFINVIPEVSVIFPLAPFAKNTDQIIIQEGTYEFISGVNFTRNTKYIGLSAFLGYDFRLDGRSGLLPWNVVARLKSRGRFLVEVEGRGFQTVINDIDTGDGEASRLAVIDRVNAGSLKYYSVNPSSTQIRTSLGYRLGTTTILKLGYLQTLLGRRSAAGSGFLISFEFGVGSDNQARPSDPTLTDRPEDSQTPRKRFNNELEKEMSTFVPDSPEVDPKFFADPVKIEVRPKK